jgi:hypothetical protein
VSTDSERDDADSDNETEPAQASASAGAAPGATQHKVSLQHSFIRSITTDFCRY